VDARTEQSVVSQQQLASQAPSVKSHVHEPTVVTTVVVTVGEADTPV
jgi:hypothetical protein